MKSSLKPGLLIGLLLWVVPCWSQKSETRFSIFLKDKVIGELIATEERKGTEIIHDILSKTDAKVMVFTVHVESDMKIKKGNGVMVEGTAYRLASRGAADVHANTVRLGPNQYQSVRNGEKKTFTQEDITFCVADLFFKEPKGLSQLYSNMYAQMLKLKSLGGGRYEVQTPDGKNTVYTYVNGKLMQMDSTTPVGAVITKRK